MSMRGINTNINYIRTRVYAEVAKLSYEYKDGDVSLMNQIPYNVIPGIVSTYRESAFLERSIVRERTRMAMGLNQRSFDEYNAVTDGAEEAVKPEKFYEPPLIDIIKFACHKCPDNEMRVTSACQGCLAHPCMEVCPKDAIRFKNGKAEIDLTACIRCGKCKDVCQFGAILHMKRPCMTACGMKAIRQDEYGYSEIDQDKCVSCGMCIANCPFGAISDKAQIFQTIQALKSDVPVYAAIAPAIIGQFGAKLTPGKIRDAFRKLGFEDVVEVAVGADLCTIEEANEFIKDVPERIPYMGTSCCPAWYSMTHKLFPDQAKCISMALTPMVLTGRLTKRMHPGCMVAFIGPCAAKKLEASRESIRSDIDFVLTFEEVMGMFEAKNINFDELNDEEWTHESSADGRGFCVSGGVANAVAKYIRQNFPDKELKIEFAEGLDACIKMLHRAKAGRLNGYLLEGMACPGGCVAGVGTVQPIAQSQRAVQNYQKASVVRNAHESDYLDILEFLEEGDLDIPEDYDE